jgi:hypothetical protein
MIIDNSETQWIGAGDLGSIITAYYANMDAYLANIDEAVPLTAAPDCGRIEFARCYNHINRDQRQ